MVGRDRGTPIGCPFHKGFVAVDGGRTHPRHEAHIISLATPAGAPSAASGLQWATSELAHARRSRSTTRPRVLLGARHSRASSAVVSRAGQFAAD